MQYKIYNVSGQVVSESQLPQEWFDKINTQLIYDKIKVELANRRQGSAHTKTRAEVSGGGRKPWRQKGTGRARHGSTRSPIWVGGGIAFGPRMRDYHINMPKKMKQRAISSTLAYWILNHPERYMVVEDFTVESGKTKDFVSILSQLRSDWSKRVVFIFKEDDPLMKRAMRNIPWLEYMSSSRLMSHSLFYAKDIIITKSALEDIRAKYIEQ